MMVYKSLLFALMSAAFVVGQQSQAQAGNENSAASSSANAPSSSA